MMHMMTSFDSNCLELASPIIYHHPISLTWDSQLYTIPPFPVSLPFIQTFHRVSFKVSILIRKLRREISSKTNWWNSQNMLLLLFPQSTPMVSHVFLHIYLCSLPHIHIDYEPTVTLDVKAMVINRTVTLCNTRLHIYFYMWRHILIN